MLRPYMGKHIGMPLHFYLTTSDAMRCVPTIIRSSAIRSVRCLLR